MAQRSIFRAVPVKFLRVTHLYLHLSTSVTSDASYARGDLPIWCLAGMASRVIIQMFLAREALAANRAIVRLVGGVSLHVTLQRGRVREHVKADSAGEHGPTQVALAVTRQVVRVRERFAAYLQEIHYSLNARARARVTLPSLTDDRARSALRT